MSYEERFARIIEAGVPAQALAFYGRWWQLENWLREVAYVELFARHGSGWPTHLGERTIRRAAGEQRNAYMPTADADELLAYSDVGALFELIEEHWELFAPLLPPRRTWSGVADQLQQLRHRNAHLRRPHRDDLSRVEQALRDLEAGAWRFYSSYVDTHRFPDSRDPLAKAWVKGRHSDAGRLLDHAERQYETRFGLWYSTRPWSGSVEKSEFSGSAGVLVHAKWLVAGRELNVARLWREITEQAFDQGLLIHLLFELGHVTATFSALDGPEVVADAIGNVFDAILMSTVPFKRTDPDRWLERSLRGAELLPRKVRVDGPLVVIDPLQEPLSIFAA